MKVVIGNLAKLQVGMFQYIFWYMTALVLHNNCPILTAICLCWTTVKGNSADDYLKCFQLRHFRNRARYMYNVRSMQVKWYCLLCVHDPQYSESYNNFICDVFQADVLVNTTQTDLILSIGAVSFSLLEEGGMEIQQECTEKKPTGLNIGGMVESTGGKLQCKKIFHVVLPVWNNGLNDSEKVSIFIVWCCFYIFNFNTNPFLFFKSGYGLPTCGLMYLYSLWRVMFYRLQQSDKHATEILSKSMLIKVS